MIIQLFMLAVAITGLVLLARNLSADKKIEYFEVEGNTFVEPGFIIDSVCRPELDTIVTEKDLFRLKNSLEKQPFIRKADLSFKSNDKLLIEIDERKPVAQLIDSGGNLHFVDREGVILPYEHYDIFCDLPILRLIKTDSAVDKEALAGAIRIINELDKEENYYTNRTVSEIIYDARNKGFDFLSSDFGIRIIFGKADDIPGKLSKLAFFWKKEMPETTPGRIRYVDLRWAGQVVLKTI